MENRKFKLLIVLAWLGFAIDIVSSAVGCFDVRVYYNLGRCGYIVSEIGPCVFIAWFIIALNNRKSWARKTAITLPIIEILSVALVIILIYLNRRLEFQLGGETSLTLTESIIENLCNGNLIVGLLWLVSLVVSIGCMCLCFCKDVVSIFMSDNKVKCVKTRFHAIAWWIGFLAIEIGSGIFGVYYDGTEQWKEDCVKAAVAGSKSARKEFIDKWLKRQRLNAVFLANPQKNTLLRER